MRASGSHRGRGWKDLLSHSGLQFSIHSIHSTAGGSPIYSVLVLHITKPYLQTLLNLQSTMTSLDLVLQLSRRGFCLSFCLLFDVEAVAIANRLGQGRIQWWQLGGSFGTGFRHSNHSNHSYAFMRLLHLLDAELGATSFRQSQRAGDELS